MRRFVIPIAALVGAGAIGGIGAVGVWEALETDDEPVAARVADYRADQETATGGALSLGEIYRSAAPGVVQIEVTRGARGEEPGLSPFPAPPRLQTAGGTGFVIDDEGRILTNHHVVEDATSVTVTFANGDEAEARVVGSDPSTDVALLELEEDRDVTALELGSSERLEVGDPIAAIGSPFGLGGTLTTGIVSALDRDIQAPNGFTIDGAIQTDAALNSGNSGGPLIDARGRVVGIASQIRSESGGNVGIGYAVPIETAQRVVEQLLSGDEIRYAYLGVSLGEATDEGVELSSVVDGGPADEAGLRAGDVVTQVDGGEVSEPDEVREAVAAKEPGDELTLEVRRGDDTETFEVELGERPEQVE